MNATRGRRKAEQPPSRVGKRSITVWLPDKAAMRVKKLAIDLDVSLNGLMEEAVEMVFEKYDTAPSA